MSKSAEKAYFKIREMILNGVFLPGDHLSEEQLSAAIGVSRTPIRDALRRLEGDYFVTIRANRGAKVRGWDAEDIEDLFQLRALIEGYAARRAAERASKHQKKVLLEQIERIDKALANKSNPDIDVFLEANNTFHSIICNASGNVRLRDMIDALVAQAVVVRTAKGFSVDDLRRSNFHHKEMADAIAEGDGELAETIMKTHILAADRAFRKSNAQLRKKSGPQR